MIKSFAISRPRVIKSLIICAAVHAGNSQAQLSPLSCLGDVSQEQLDCTPAQIKLYAGPQSVRSGQSLYIVAEVLNHQGASAHAEYITLKNERSGASYNLTVTQGLAHIDLTAPPQSGRVLYTARLGKISSNAAEILVGSAPLTKFEIDIKPSGNGFNLRTSELTDAFGNLLEDGYIAHLTLHSSQAPRLKRQYNVIAGQVFAALSCANLTAQDTQLSLAIHAQTQTIALPPALCPERFASW